MQDDLTGYFNLTQLSQNSFESVAHGQSVIGSESGSLNFESKVNRYDKPYSYARFMFGSFQSNTYGIDFTRAVTNDLGLYVSGQYYKTAGFREHTDAQRSSVYTNVYYNRFFPARLDMFYSNYDYGFPGSSLEAVEGRQKDRFLDVSTTLSFRHSVMNFFYNARSAVYADSQNARFVEHYLKQYGAALGRHHDLLGIELDYGVTSYFLDIDGTLTSYSDVPLYLWARLSKAVQKFSFQAAGYFATADDHENFYCPKVAAGYDFHGSTQLYVSLARDARAPSDLELNAMFDTLNPYFTVAGNRDLVSEYCWIQEFGVRSDHYAVSYYRRDYENFISINAGSLDYYEYVNTDSWLIAGCEAFFDFPVRFYNTDSSRTFSLIFGGSGNILFDGDSVPFTPDYVLGGHLSFTRDTERFGFGAALVGEMYGKRFDLSGQEMPGFGVISAAGFVRFMDLSVVARINNIFDEYYEYVAHYPMPPRSYDFSVKWEFWD
jgi:outer membrane receptor protein involved in Fe transport